MPESRSEKRKERYRELRALGFTPDRARQLRDHSGKNIQRSISTEQRRISRKPPSMRTSEESFRLRRIQDRNRSQNRIQSDGRILERQQRWENWSEWSKTNIWPRDMRRIARALNEQAGRPPDDGYGFRRLYYMYVERMPDERSEILAERNDSEMRFLTNKPLIRGRQNLRALLRSPADKRGEA